MFDYIKGTLIGSFDTYAVVDVGGMGYRITTSAKSLQKAGNPGDVITFYTYLHVREDIFELYGFTTLQERSIFELLITVSGVGPKAAISILSALSSKELVLAIATGDSKAITVAPGIGPKTAQRIILELKDKISKMDIGKDAGFEDIPQKPFQNDAVEALVALGYSPSQAARAVSSVKEGLALEQTIKEALKNLMKNP
ncbi:MAG: Holliday junction branch migration protein RuvA [Eubacteriales bacterium]|jgi:Holliday junction DNA helicase RuvA|nr:Holliday junction branch migration protein RuvA [Eubacteriales bacterium]